MSPAARRPWETPHAPSDTVVPFKVGVPGVTAGISRIPVDASDRVAGLWWAARAAGVEKGRVALLHQVHGAGVVSTPWPGFPQEADGDALVTDEAGLVLCVRVADCAGLVLADSAGRGIAMVHAGWRGAAAGVVGAAVEALCEAAGCAPQAVRAVIGPAIGACCYEVGPEFADHFEERFLEPSGTGRLRFDLPGRVRADLVSSGLDPSDIVDTAWCTVCGKGAPAGLDLHSHRGSSGAPGRNIAFVVRSGG